MVVNVCPAAITPASPGRVWRVLTTPERFGEWNDATFVSAQPPGQVTRGQRLNLAARSAATGPVRWAVTIDIEAIDPHSRWIDLLVRLPFGIVNHEHVTLTQTEAGGTLVRFN